MPLPRTVRLPRVALALLLAVSVATAGGCGRGRAGGTAVTPSFHSPDLSFMPPLEFQLTDALGAGVTAASLRGRITLLYFGYTHCPDLCPATLAYLSQVLGRLGARADQVRVAFVSVDPRRDTPEVLKQYMSYFAPQVLGMTGTDEQLTALTKRYRAAYRRDPPAADGSYAVYHSSAIYVFDQRGRSRLLASDTEPAAALAADLQALMR